MSDNSNLSRVIIYFFVAAAMLAMPMFLTSFGLDTTGAAQSGSGSLGGFSQGIQQGMSELINVMSSVFYLAGIGFGLKAILELKAHSEGYSYDVSEEQTETEIEAKTENKIEETKVEKKEEKLSAPIEIKEEVVKRKLPVGYPKNLDTEDDKLNQHILAILNKIKDIQKIPALSTLIEEKMLLENTRDEYLLKIVNSYVSIPQELRKKSLGGKPSAREMVVSQLEMIDEKLVVVEEDALHAQQREIRINNAVLKEHFEVNEDTFAIDESLFIQPSFVEKSAEKEVEIELNS
jgi:hypothetical protein